MAGLSKDDFEVLDNGRPQPITHFAEEGASPLTAALLIDSSLSALKILEQEGTTARQFFSHVLRPEDRAMIVGFGQRVFIWQDLTASSADLNSALGRIGPLTSSDPKAGTVLYDAVSAAAHQLKALQGRKVMVILSDGLENGSAIKLGDASRAAQDSEAVIFAVHQLDPDQFNYLTLNSMDLTAGAQLTGWATSVGMRTLRDLSDPTGGRTFHIDKRTTLDSAFAMILDETHHEYELGFVAPPTEAGGQYHRLEVRCRRQGLKVRARTGYYSNP
jgi:Ca-activated chloride channel family protein